MSKNHAVIIGGGISGLSVAYYLSKIAAENAFPLKLTLLEAKDSVGGAILTRENGSLVSEAGPDAFVLNKEMVDLCRDLGLQEELIDAGPCFRHFFIFKKKKLIPVPLSLSSFASFAFFGNPSLSFFAKCRMLCEPWVPPRKETSDESVGRFVKRRLGGAFLKEVAMPILRGVYMAEPATLSMQAMFSQWQESEKAYGSLAEALAANQGREIFHAKEYLTLKNGLQTLPKALAQRLNPSELRLSSPVEWCEYEQGWDIALSNEEVLHAECVCLAMPAPEAAKLIRNAAFDIAQDLGTIAHDSLATVNFLFKTEDVSSVKIDPGFIVPADLKSCPFSSLKWLGKIPGRTHVAVRAFLSEALLPWVFLEKDETLLQRVLKAAQDLLGIQAAPQFGFVERYPKAFPQYEIGHLERIQKVESDLQKRTGLYLTGNAYEGFGVTACVGRAKKTAARIFEHCRRLSEPPTL